MINFRKYLVNGLLIILSVFISVRFTTIDAQAAAAFISASHKDLNGTASTIVVDKPASVVTNTVMVAGIHFRPNTLTITPPSGWTLVRRQDNSNSTESSLAVYRKVAGGSEPTTYTWSFSVGSTGSSGIISAFSGVNTTTPVNVSGGASTTVNGTTFTAPSVTTTVANTMIVTIHGNTNADNWAPPAGMTEAAQASSVAIPNDIASSLEMNYVLQASTGATGAKTATSSPSTADMGMAVILALSPAPAAPGIPDMTAGTDTGSSSTDDITNDTTPSFTISCVTGSIVTLFDGVTSIGSGTCAGGTVTITSSVLSSGVHSINAKQDGSVASGNLSITIDNTADAAPGIPDMTAGTDTGSSSTDNITSDTTPDFAISCVTGSTVTLFDNITSVGTGTCAGGTVTITSSTLSSGTHATMNAKQTDPAGNISVASGNLSIAIDVTAPSAPGTAPDMTAGSDTGASSTDNITSDNTPTFTGSCTTGETVNLYADGVLVGSGICSASAYSITASALTPDGVFLMTTKFADVAGNLSPASPSLSITIDTSSPTLVEVTPVPTPTTDTTPSYTFSSTQAGTITYGGDCSSATTSASAGNNTVTFNALSIGTHSNCTITVTDTAGNISAILNVSPFTIDPANNPIPTTTNISPTSKTAGDTTFTLTVNGTNFISGSIVRFDGSNRTTTFVNANQVTASIPTSDMTTPGTFIITVFNPTPGGGTSNGQTFTVNAPTVDHFVVTNTSDGNIAAQTAGTPFNIKIVAKDASNNTVTSFTGSVILSNNLGGISPVTSGSFTAGVLSSQSITLTVAGTDSITATDSGETGTSNNFTVNAGAVSQFTIDDPGDMTAGDRIGYTVTRKDQFGNLVTAGTSTAYLYTNSTGTFGKFFNAGSGGSQIVSVNITPGNSTAQFWYEEGTAGSWSVTVSDDASAPDGAVGIDDASDTVAVSAGPTAKFILNDPGDMTVGTRLQYTVTRYDEFDNLVTEDDDTVYLYSTSTSPTKVFYNVSSGGSPITSIEISSGVSSANFWYFDDLEGNWTIRGSDNSSTPDGNTGINDGSDDVEVSNTPIVATKFIIEDPLDGTVGDIIQVTIRAVDGSNALDTTYESDVTLIATGSAIGGGVVDIVGGIGTMNITDEVAETVSLALSDTEGTGLDTSSTQNMVFSTGPTAQFSLDDPGNMTVGSRIGYTVVRQDEFDNFVTTGTDTVYLYTNSTGGLGFFYDAPSGGSVISSVTISGGASAGQFWYQEGTAGSWSVTVSDNNSAPDGSAGVDDATDAVTVSAVGSPATKIVIESVADVQVGTTFGVIIRAKDNSNNVDTSFNGFVTLVSSGNTTGAGVVMLVNGVGSINLTATSVGTVTLSLSDTGSTGLNVSSTQDFEITSDAPPPSTGGGDPTPPPPSSVLRFEGVGFPGGRVNVLSVPTGNIAQGISAGQETISETGGDFQIDITDPQLKSNLYVLTMYDVNGGFDRSRIFRNAPDSAVFSDIFSAPTLVLNRSSIRQGDLFIARGRAYPFAVVELDVDNLVFQGFTAKATADGSYSFLVNSSNMAFGKHSLRVRQAFGSEKSDFSLSKAFNISDILRPIIDFNDDGAIDVRDINIFRTTWSFQNEDARARIDLNNDLKVDISDLSIFVQLLKRR